MAAALFGVGIQSLLGRDEDAANFRALLYLKIIWSQLEGGPLLGWAFAGIFAAFNVLRVRYRWALREPDAASAPASAPDCRRSRGATAAAA